MVPPTGLWPVVRRLDLVVAISSFIISSPGFFALACQRKTFFGSSLFVQSFGLGLSLLFGLGASFGASTRFCFFVF